VIRSVIIDGDIVAYQAAAAAEVAIEWEHDLWSVYSDLAKAEDIATKEIEDIANATKATKLILAFTDTHNFRKDVMPEYKANRSKKPKPIGLKPLKDRLGQRFTTYTKPGLEGDDVMGILATHPTLLPGQRIVVSIDKDMKTIPGIHYNPRTEKTLVCEPQIADYWHLFQTLTGDRGDGVRQRWRMGCHPEGVREGGTDGGGRSGECTSGPHLSPHGLRLQEEPSQALDSMTGASRYDRANPERKMCRDAKRRALKNGIPFSITPEDIYIGKRCPLLEIELIPGDRDYAPTLDRIDPRKGYVPGNVWVISMKANRIKNNATVDELEQLVFSLRAHDLLTHKGGVNG
jgi:DNA polymerase-1